MAAWLFGQLILLFKSSATASAPASVPVVCQFEVFELKVAKVDTFPDPFDSRTTPLATFSLGNSSNPGRNVSVRAFVFQNYTRSWDGDREQLQMQGNLTFLVRFAPPTAGRWIWTVRTHANAIIGSGTLQAVACSSRPVDGFVRVSASGQHFVLSNSGRGIFPVRAHGS